LLNRFDRRRNTKIIQAAIFISLNKAVSRSMKQQARTLLSEFCRKLGSDTLSFRIYHDRELFTFERRLVERGGSSFTMVLQFSEPQAARKFLVADPYYSQVKKDVGRVLVRLDRAWRNTDGKANN
jgi:hypothetical protein